MVAAAPDDARRRLSELGIDERRGERLGAEHLLVGRGEWRLVGRRANVAGQHARARVVEDRRLDAPSEQRVGLPHEVLVERVLRRDQHRESRSRRPARPHCWRNDATVPGKPTEMTTSSRPMSIPSSSAFVDETPSSSPPASRRSISRRCAGV